MFYKINNFNETVKLIFKKSHYFLSQWLKWLLRYVLRAKKNPGGLGRFDPPPRTERIIKKKYLGLNSSSTAPPKLPVPPDKE